MWHVTTKTSGQELALKLASKSATTNSIRREFAFLKKLDVAGIVKVITFGEHEGCDYFTMEFVEGSSVTEYFASKRTEKGFVELFLEVFQRSSVILSDLHKQGIVHLDVKPSNLLVKEDGEPVLLDFGFAEDYVLSPTAEPSGTTLDYAAPELFSGGQVSPAADIYSMGAIAYEVLSGKKLWEDKSLRELIAAKLKSPPGLGKVEFDLPSGFETLVLRMLNPDPGLRPSAAEILSEISWMTRGEKTDVSTPVMIPRLVFGGRDEEMEELERLVFEEKRVVSLSGESGTGKTRLLRELRFKALVDGRNVLHLEGRSAHISLVDYISTTLGVKHPEINPDSDQRPDKWSRYERVYQGIEGGGFDGVFIDAPLDLSEDEAGLLGYLARGFDRKKGLIVSQVPEEIHPEAAKVELKSLDEDAITGLLSRTFGEMKDSERLSRTVSSLSEGNPRRMNELLDILHQETWLTWNRGWVYEPGKDEKGLAKKMESWLGESISKLDADSRKTLDLLAIAGSPLPEEVLSDVIGKPAQLILRQLLHRGYAGSFLCLDRSHYDLGNDVIKPYLLSVMTDEYRKQLARPLAKTLEEFCIELWGKNAEAWDRTLLVKVAELFFKGGTRDVASRYLAIAGKYSQAAYDFSKAKVLLLKALRCKPGPKTLKTILCGLARMSHIEHNPRLAERFYTKVLHLIGNKKEKKADILLRMGSAYQWANNFDKANLIFQQSEDCLPNLPSITKCNLYSERGWNAFNKGNLDEAQSYLEKCIDMDIPSEEKIVPYQRLGIILHYRGETSKALRISKKSLRLAQECGTKGWLCQAILNVIAILQSLGKTKEIEKLLDEALFLTKETNYPWMMSEVLRYKTYFLFKTGHFREAYRVVKQTIELSSKTGDNYALADLRHQEIQILRELGDWEDVQRLCSQFWRNFWLHDKRTILHTTVLAVMENWANVYRLTGDFMLARRILIKAKHLAAAWDDKNMSLWVEIGLCQISLALCEFNEAKMSIDRCRQLLTRQEEFTAKTWLDILETEIILVDGNVRRAFELSSRTMSIVEKYKLEDMRMESILVFGRVLLAMDRYEQGLIRLRQGLELSKSREQPYQQGLSLFAIAEAMLKHKGLSDEVVSTLDEAQIIFERLGVKPYLEKIDALKVQYFQSQKTPSYGYLDGFKKVTALINWRQGKENFMDELLDTVIGFTEAQRGIIFVLNGKTLHPLALNKIDALTFYDAQKFSRTAIEQIKKGLEPVYTSDTANDERFNRSESILLNKIRSLICIPLMTNDGLAGILYLDSQKAGSFDAEKILYFESLGNLLAATLDKSIEVIRLKEKLALKGRKENFGKPGIVIGSSNEMIELYKRIEQIARSDANILLEGETGTGKGIVAKMIHERSTRKNKEFCCINCGILPENIFESELFGCKKGAYTGATQDRVGLLEAASGSTVFFDEITNTSLAVQAKFLEVIEDKVIRRLGDTKKRNVDLRFIFATNRDLAKEVQTGRFREDLYFRLCTLSFKLPALRGRKEDIPEFVDFFMNKCSKVVNNSVVGIKPDALEVLLRYPWPGNIRELKSAIERAVILAEGKWITKELLEERLFNHSVQNGTRDHARYKLQGEELVRHIKKTLKETKGNVTEAASRLGVSRRHLYRLCKQYGIPLGTGRKRKSL